MEFKFNTPAIDTKYNVLKAYYKRTYLEYCAEHPANDKRIFINVYRQTIRALLVMDKIYGQSCLLDCAMYKEISEQFALLSRIKDKFAA